ncbi:MAG: T9SS type A sorting domain-containing protein, partial [Bacteroidales bacterium]|jgi:hypothetical protein|nr:T9SS type A sorting domain-containing protein [Bacteroidales bacterium]
LDIFTPNCTGSIETISSDCYASEYSVVSVTGGATYTFSSSVSSDFITLTNWTGTTIYEIGTGSLTVNANVSTTVRFYTHTNSNCGAENLPRSRNVTCNTSSNPPANDNCSNAINLTCGVVTTGTLTGATPTANVSYSQSSKNDVFYYFTATNSGDYTISLSNFFGDFDLFLHPDCNSATFLESSTQTSSTETITYNCAANTTYRIRITDYQSTGGSFNLLLTCPTITVPSNDQCANYTTLSCGSTLNGTTVGATAKSVTDNTASPYGVWYSFLGDGQQTTISSSANYDHELVLFSGSCNSLSYITNNDDNNTYDSPNGYGSALTFNTVSGTRYYVYVAYYSSTGNETQTGVFNISRTCTAQTYSITATADTNGSISPSGSVSVTGGNSQIFTITPNSGYQISQVLVDGSNVGAVSSYPFSNVTANHTISASFSPLQYTITASADEHSNIYPSGEVIVDFGNNQEFTFTFNEGYELEAVLIDGTYTNFYANSWMFSNVISDCSIHVISKAVSDGIEDVLAKQLFIFPNPVKKELFIKTDLAIEKIEIYSLTGSLLLSEDNFTGKISMQNLAQGVYLLKAYTDKGLAVSKIVKER